MRMLFSAVVLATGLSSGLAMAQTAAERSACEADFKKFCAGVVPGGGRGEECLAKQLDKLTPECKAVIEAHMPK